MKTAIRTLLLNGKPFDPTPSFPIRQKIAAYLDSHLGEVFTRDVLHNNVPAGKSAVREFSTDPKYASYISRSGKNVVFGTPSAIKEYQALIESSREREN